MHQVAEVSNGNGGRGGFRPCHRVRCARRHERREAECEQPAPRRPSRSRRACWPGGGAAVGDPFAADQRWAKGQVHCLLVLALSRMAHALDRHALVDPALSLHVALVEPVELHFRSARC